MMKTQLLARFGAVLLTLMGFATPIAAQDNVVVVELYTSQGCNSCPPADELLIELAARDDVLPLALHVDYWDYIGWEDSFGDPAYTTRQQGYARAAGQRTIFTPQFVIAGQEHIVGAKAMELADTIRDHRADLGQMAITLDRSGNQLSITAQPGAGLAQQDMVVQLVRYIPQQSVDIRRGENAGKTISYANIVTDWRVLGNWDGTAAMTMNARIPGNEQVAVIIQNASFGPILAAAKLN